jgi:hypothetical protein
MVLLTGLLVEYYNLTELSQVSSATILSSNNPIPITLLSTADMPNTGTAGEAYEGVFVRFENVQIKSTIDSYGQFKIADSSGVQSMVDDVLYAPPASQIVVNQWWYVIQGVGDFHSVAKYKILPRSAEDMIRVDDISNSSIRIQSISNAALNEISTVNVTTTKLNPEWGVREYTMTVRIDPAVVIYQGYEIDGTLTMSNPTVTISPAGDEIVFKYAVQESITTPVETPLLKLKFEPLNYGDIVIDLYEFKYDDVSITSLIDGRLQVKISKKVAHLNISTDTSGKNIFDPTMNEKINLEYGTQTGFLARALIRIYDAQGRLVATPVHQNIASSTGIESYAWNGRDSNMKPLVPGLYYCHLEISVRETSKRAESVQPIVIKSRLK